MHVLQILEEKSIFRCFKCFPSYLYCFDLKFSDAHPTILFTAPYVIKKGKLLKKENCKDVNNIDKMLRIYQIIKYKITYSNLMIALT